MTDVEDDEVQALVVDNGSGMCKVRREKVVIQERGAPQQTNKQTNKHI